MSELPHGSLSEYVRWRFERDDAHFDKTKAAEFLFDIAEQIIDTTNPERERFRFPLTGNTAFYQGKHSDVLVIDRLATDELTVLPYYDPETDVSRSLFVKLAVDTRNQYKRNRLPVPVAFGRLALSSTAYRDKVLRVIQTDREESSHTKSVRKPKPAGINYESTLLLSNLNYGAMAQCGASAMEIITVADHIETVSQLLGAHDVIEDTVLMI